MLCFGTLFDQVHPRLATQLPTDPIYSYSLQAAGSGFGPEGSVFFIAFRPRIKGIIFVEGQHGFDHVYLIQRHVFTAIEIQDPHGVIAQDF
jgi:hypothetical protein